MSEPWLHYLSNRIKKPVSVPPREYETENLMINVTSLPHLRELKDPGENFRLTRGNQRKKCFVKVQC